MKQHKIKCFHNMFQNIYLTKVNLIISGYSFRATCNKNTFHTKQPSLPLLSLFPPLQRVCKCWLTFLWCCKLKKKLRGNLKHIFYCFVFY